MKKEQLRSRAAKGSIWNLIQNFFGRFITFFGGIILARLLMPEDYGLIGMTALFMSFSGLFIHCGFGSALIQKKNPTHEDYCTVFYFNMFMAILMYTILFFSAPFIARFYNSPIFCIALRIYALTIILDTANSIQTNILRKKMEFTKLSKAGMSVTLFSMCCLILLAWLGLGVWALIIQGLINSFFTTCLYWNLSKWRPSICFSFKALGSLFKFGSFLFFGSLLNNATGDLRKTIIGRMYPASTLGLYTKAQHIYHVIISSVTGTLQNITFPMYAECQNDLKMLGTVIKRLGGTIQFLTYPIIVLSMFCAKPLIIVLYSARWAGSIEYFQLLIFAGFAACLNGVNLSPINAIGKSKVFFISSIYKRTVGLVIVILPLVLWGLEGMLWGVIVNAWFCFIYSACLVSKHIGYKLWRQLLDLAPIAILTASAALISYCSTWFFGIENMYLKAGINTVVFLAIYLGVAFGFKFESAVYTKSLIPVIFGGLLKKFRKPKAIEEKSEIDE